MTTASRAVRTERTPSELETLLAFQMRALALPAWEAEYRFHRARRWRFDLAWPYLRLAVEIEGGTWTGGRHTSPVGFEADCEKYNEAAILGWRVIRVTSRMVRDGRAVDTIQRAIGAS